MNGFCGIFSGAMYDIDEFAFIKSINLADTMETQSVSSENFFSAVSFLGSTPLKGSRLHKTNDFIFLFAGDLIDYKEIPWNAIETNFSSSNFQWFSTLRGFFGFAILDLKQKKISLISDHLAQVPIYYIFIKNSFVFSTDISTFTTLELVPNFNVEWLYEYLYFNFPIHTTTCLKGVKRIPSLSMVSFDLLSKKSNEIQYSERFKKSEKLLSGKVILDNCIKTIKDRISSHYSDDRMNLVATTAGIDSRVLLALTPEKTNLETYTYGVSRTSDLLEASKLTDTLNVNHRKILFDDNFIKALPNLIYETVRLSGGAQSIIRSTLLYTYQLLANRNDKDTPVVMSGIAGEIFRGGGGVPQIMSHEIDDYFRTGKIATNQDIHQKMFGKNLSNFQNHIEKSLERIKKLYGDPSDIETHLLYDCYEVIPKYFGGEYAIASNYLTFRAPYLDADLIKLVFKTKYSGLSFSKYANLKKNTLHQKYLLQAKVISTNTVLKKTSLNGIPISHYLYDSYFLFKICRLFIRGYAYLRGFRPNKIPLEDWDCWFSTVLSKEFDKLLNENSLILDYIDLDFIQSLKKSNNILLLNKLVTTEILLNLIKNKWNIYTDNSN